MTALITGASAGIGQAFAERLAKDGSDVVLVARRRDRLDALAKRLHAERGVAAEVLEADLTTDVGLRSVEDRAGRGDVTLLVNNAGFGAYQPFVTLDPGTAEELVRIHVLAVVRLSRAALPAMVERGSGGIVNVASMLAFSGTIPPERLPYRATYAGAKSFMVTFTQALAGELAGTGVEVQVCCPGVVETEFHTVQEMTIPPVVVAMKPESVVDESLAALGRGDVVCLPPYPDGELFDKISEAQVALFGAAIRRP